MEKFKNLVIMRHGQSLWNQKNLFTGWEDSDLTSLGEKEARNAAKTLLINGLSFDIAYTSLLTRAIRTLWITLEELNQVWIPIFKNWKLNERHYGHLTGLNKLEMEKKFSPEQVKIWRKSYHYQPQPIGNSHKLWSGLDNRYSHINKKDLPEGESLKETVVRVSNFWNDYILPDLEKNNKVIISAHGNSIRALLMYIENITPEDIEELNIPRATPILLKFNKENKFISREFLYTTSEIEN